MTPVDEEFSLLHANDISSKLCFLGGALGPRNVHFDFQHFNIEDFQKL